MRIELKKLLGKLGVSHALSSYEAHPWFLYDENKGITCSAEVRMGPSAEDIEAEIQFLHDDKDDEDSGDSSAPPPPNKREQILWMRCEPATEDKWAVKILKIKDKDYTNEFHDWEEKGCEFFLSCVEALNMGEIPDVDTLLEEKMKDDTMWGKGGRGRVGRKSPKVKPGALMGMKK